MVGVGGGLQLRAESAFFLPAYPIRWSCAECSFPAWPGRGPQSPMVYYLVRRFFFPTRARHCYMQQ